MPMRQITAPTTASPKRMIIFGNSLAWHSPAPQIGWTGDWGMAASAEDKDFAHVLAAKLKERYGDIDCRVSQGAEWERAYHDGVTLKEKYADAHDFAADIAVIRIGENIPGEDMERFSLTPYFIDMVRWLSPKPGAITVVTDMFWADGKKDIAARSAADYLGAVFVSINDLGSKDENKAIGLFEHQGVAGHPSDLGMKRIAERIFEGIREKP